MLAAALSATASTMMAQAPSQAPAVAVTPVAQTADVGKNQGLHEKKMDKNIKVEKNPDAALIDYLGEYDDAADGLDPMGLADPDAPPAKSGGDRQ